MKKEKLAVLAQLLTAIKDTIEKLEDAKREKDAEKMASAKREIMIFQGHIGEIL